MLYIIHIIYNISYVKYYTLYIIYYILYIIFHRLCIIYYILHMIYPNDPPPGGHSDIPDRRNPRRLLPDAQFPNTLLYSDPITLEPH